MCRKYISRSAALQAAGGARVRPVWGAPVPLASSLVGDPSGRQSMKVLITGGAGFIGSHLADMLLAHGHEVRVLDAMVTQVHGGSSRPEYINPGVEFMMGDVRDANVVRAALYGIDAVYHFAALVGVGQSMYEVAEYTSVNSWGTAVLMEALAKRPVQKLVVASSMSVYGEGHWHMGTSISTSETYPPGLPNVYALTKYDQERMCLLVGEASGIPTTALRFFNVYGPRQALSNPYTGVIAIFASRLLNDRPPLIYEDGLQSRDFVSVHDIVQACVLALGPTVTGVFNVGTGVATTVLQVARTLAEVLGKDIAPRFTGTKRIGDIRHCFADIGKARRLLGYEPHVTLEDGLVELAEWLQGQKPTDSVERAARELTARGLAV